ncbi:hypothetical protein FQR65_LT00827 [Abscondita terminalis]|nr:hypothetical protein FQR65_LT00827 [Abscondita terminalis]
MSWLNNRLLSKNATKIWQTLTGLIYISAYIVYRSEQKSGTFLSSAISYMQNAWKQHRKYGGMAELLCLRRAMAQDTRKKNEIRDGRCNINYKDIMREWIPQYITGGLTIQEKKTVVIFRLGNEERENQYWKEDEERLCRMCRNNWDNIKHLTEHCAELREEKRKTEILLGELSWMKGNGK